MNKAVAFAPGHISGFFQPLIDKTNVDKTGSRGAGVCISHGATTTVCLEKDNEQHLDIIVNGKNGDFTVTQKAIKLLLGDRQFNVTVNVCLDLPVGQGFGMSAASALSSSLALTKILGKPQKNAVQAAHQAEVEHHTGLGDVATSAIGGFEIREKPGIPPFGKIHKIDEDSPLLLGLFPGSISTRDVLTNTNKIDAISRIGKECTNSAIKNPMVNTIFHYSYYFTKKTNLASDQLRLILQKINETDQASMCMLGHSLFAKGKLHRIKKQIPSSVTIIETDVDNLGARVLHSPSNF